MQKLSFIFFLVLTTFYVHGQLEVGIKAGVSSIDLANTESIQINSNQEILSIQLADAEYGVHFGIYSRLSFLGFYLEPALIFNSSSFTYKVESFGESGLIENLKSETYRSVDFPVLFGTKVGFLRIQGGPVAHFYLDSTSDLLSIDGYSKNLSESSYGFQAGIGLDIWKFRLDLNYEGNLSYFGDRAIINGESYTFDNSPARIVSHIGIKF